MGQKSKLASVVERHLAIVQLIFGGSLITAVSTVSGWLGSQIPLIARYGAAGWWFTALAGGLIATAALFLFGSARYWLARASAMEKWRDQVDTINPLETEFVKKTIHIPDIMHPHDRSILDKIFVNCRLVGPANILIHSKNSISGASFIACDIVPIKSHVDIFTAASLINVTITGGELVNCTIFIGDDMVASFQKMGATFVTRPASGQ